MENQNEENKDKAPDNEGYDINNPQNLAVPKYNSTTTHRESSGLPAIENLNQQKGMKSDEDDVDSDDFDRSGAENDRSLHGEQFKSDLGQGQRDKDEDEDEKIIRT